MSPEADSTRAVECSGRRAPEDRAERQRLKARKRLKRAIVYFLAVPIVAAFSRLPLRVARALGRMLGVATYHLIRKERRIALENLRAAFGDELSERDIRRLCRRVFVHAAVSFADVIVIRRWPAERIERAFGVRHSFDALKKVIGEGSVGITAHFGNWELLAVFFARFLPGTLVPVANRNTNERLQRYLERFRESIGLEVLYTDESPRRMFELLRREKLLGILPDQDLRMANGIFVEFFGRPAYTTTIPANLARKLGVPVHFGALVREGNGFRFVWETVPLEWSSDRAGDLAKATQAWTDVLERSIRERPEQWTWFHRRWRTQPGQESSVQDIRWARKTKRKAKRRAREIGGGSEGRDGE